MQSFHDMESINDSLSEQAATSKVFEILDEKNPKTAREVFNLAKPSLVQAKAYSLFGKYVVPKYDFAKIIRSYKPRKKLADAADVGAELTHFSTKNHPLKPRISHIRVRFYFESNTIIYSLFHQIPQFIDPHFSSF